MPAKTFSLGAERSSEAGSHTKRIQQHTLSPKNFNCEKFNKAFSLESSLRKCMLYYNEEKLIYCLKCNKYFKREYSSMRYERTHTAVKKYALFN